MLDRDGFDLWADGYEQAVGISDEENSYPFAGYREILGKIAKKVTVKPDPAVLDVGFGTGTLTAKLYEHGCRIYGQDFSAKMTEIAAARMPEAVLCQKDFTEGLAEPLQMQQYDFIIATYSLHHLTDRQKIAFLRSLIGQLKEDGEILIGDVAFSTRAEMEKCRRESGDKWDEEEIYFVAEELKAEFPALRFEKVSDCAGILTIKR